MTENKSWQEKRSQKTEHMKGGRDGDQGQGYLDEQSLNYYKRVLGMMGEEFPSEEEKEIFQKNVFKTLLSELFPASRHCRTSWTVQKLLAQATREQFLQMFTAYSEDWSRVCTDRFASHVIQELVTLIPKFMNGDAGSGPSNVENADSEQSEPKKKKKKKDKLYEVDKVGSSSVEDGEGVKHEPTEVEAPETLSFEECFQSLCSYIRGNLRKFVTDVYASHIVRVFLHVLAGVSVESKLERSQFSRKESKGSGRELVIPDTKHDIIPEWVTVLSEITEDLLSMKNLSDLIFNSVSNPVLQTLLVVLHKSNHRLSDRCWNVLVVSADLDNVEPESRLPSVLTGSVASHLIQQCVKLATSEQLDYIFSNYLKGKMLSMAVHYVANYVLQSLIEMASAERFEDIYKELKSHMEEILANNRVGVIAALVKRSAELKSKQKKLLKVVLKAFHCAADERKLKCVPVMTALTTYETYFNISEEGETQNAEKPPPTLTSDRVNLHGSLIIQHLLQMDKSDVVVSSVLDLQTQEIHNISVCSKGCHVIEAFLKSPCTTAENVDSFIQKLKGHLTELSCNKYGSRIMDKLWAKATIKQKETVAKELVKQAKKLQSDFQGKFIYRNFSLGEFESGSKSWKAKQRQDGVEEEKSPKGEEGKKKRKRKEKS